MAKLNIEIIAKRTGYTDENTKIVEIDINRGNWKYWDNQMETDEKETMTINTVCKSYYLSNPVKDEIDIYDMDLYHETGELKVIKKAVRPYNNLLEFINYRVNNVKDDLKKRWHKTEYEFDILMFKESYNKNKYNDINTDVTYVKDEELVVKITVVE